MFSVLGGLNAPVTKRQGYNAFKNEYQYAPATRKNTTTTRRRTITNYSPRNSLFNTYIQPKVQSARKTNAKSSTTTKRDVETKLKAFTSGTIGIGMVMSAIAGGGTGAVALAGVGAALNRIKKKYCGDAQTFSKFEDLRRGKAETTNKDYLTSLLNDAAQTLSRYAPDLSVSSQKMTTVDPVSGTRFYYSVVPDVSLHYPVGNAPSQSQINMMISKQQKALAEFEMGVSLGQLKASYGRDEIIWSATSTKENNTYNVSIGISREKKTLKAEYSVDTKIGNNGEITTTWGIESNPSNGTKNKFSYQDNMEIAFREKILSNTSWETAGKPTIAVVGVLVGAIAAGISGDTSIINESLEVLSAY